ncbi:MAG: NAD(P)H-binding protein [Firmicutes bacterium]|nr:NAD(P)H-binding protein [Bacillota bacterium]
MKVIIFGGTGGMGQKVVKELCSYEEIDQVTVAARNPAKFTELKNQVSVNKNKLNFITCDLEQTDLPKVIAGHELVAGAAGPFYKYEKKLASAAITAGVHYFSLCDDYDAAEQVFTLDEDARQANICVLTGVGWTPGISSLMARAGADVLDQVQKINISWAGNSDDSSGTAVILHVLHIFTGLVPTFTEGESRMVPAGSGRETVHFPGIGEITVYNVGHPEPVTIPRYFPALEEVTLKGGINEDLLNKLSLLTAKVGLSKIKPARNTLAAVFGKTLPLLRKIIGAGPDISGIRVDLTGTKEEKHYKLTYSAAGPMDILTGLPLAVAIREMARGKIQATGVFAPEAGILKPEVFFAELEKQGIDVLFTQEVISS